MHLAISWISYLSILIPAYVAFRKNIKEKLFRYFSLFIGITALSETTAAILFAYKINNIWLLNFYNLFETICYIIFLNVYTNYRAQKVLGFVGIAYFVFFLVEVYSESILAGLINHLRILESLLIVILYLFTIFNLIQKNELTFRRAEFLLVAGIVFYFSISLIVFCAYELISNESKKIIFSSIWNIHSLCNTFTNILYAYCIWLKYHQINTSK